MINDLKINLEMRFVESALSGSNHKFDYARALAGKLFFILTNKLLITNINYKKKWALKCSFLEIFSGKIFYFYFLNLICD